MIEGVGVYTNDVKMCRMIAMCKISVNNIDILACNNINVNSRDRACTIQHWSSDGQVSGVERLWSNYQ